MSTNVSAAADDDIQFDAIRTNGSEYNRLLQKDGIMAKQKFVFSTERTCASMVSTERASRSSLTSRMKDARCTSPFCPSLCSSDRATASKVSCHPGGCRPTHSVLPSPAQNGLQRKGEMGDDTY